MNKLKTLTLPIKKKWFDMIASGEKKEEYRAITDYWSVRLKGKKYDIVEFRNGYGKKVPSVSFYYKETTIKKPNPKWCPVEFLDTEFYAIALGGKVKQKPHHPGTAFPKY